MNRSVPFPVEFFLSRRVPPVLVELPVSEPSDLRKDVTN